MLGKLSNILVLLLACHIAIRNIMSAPRDGNLTRLGEGEIVGVLEANSAHLVSPDAVIKVFRNLNI
ncbi:60S ribosomal protein L18-3 [Iris pallida]|uniref:60S ribosomal protein L18-3 n=1 Tax=Iris pallida TaxID=29817 RepID=A0AAX6FK43_IRIPA|nr:60S ribosomal protein L18-3 [Iris pallida]